ncbi:MAG: PDDEXK nuclease domain-containing protein [Verrucomicrobiales bacterium]
MPAKKKAKLAHRTVGGGVPAESPLLAELRHLIEDARTQVARIVDAGLTLLYWQVGHRIHSEVLGEKRAEYGAKIVVTVSRELEAEFGRGFEEKNLRRMVQFAEVFPDHEIVVTLSRQLSWSHFIELIPLNKPHQRDFYAEMCRIERWSVRTLRQKINGMLYERTALSKKPDTLIKQELDDLRDQDRLTPDLVFRDPYFLDFLGLQGAYSERDLESAILRDIESFLVELGSDFAFIARQKRIVVDGDDFYLDLLFFHRSLRRLVVIDLKLGKFAPGDVGQMEFYMRWLKKHEMRPGEEEPLGLILCAEKSDERIEVFELATRGIRVAEYLTALPPKHLLEEKLHHAVELARQRIGAGEPSKATAQPKPASAAKPIDSKAAPTPQQGQFLAFILEYMFRNVHGVAPTHAALQRFFNLTPPSVNSMLVRLESRGFIRRIPGQARAIELTINHDLIPPLDRPFKV